MRLLLFMIALAGAGTARADGQCEKNRTFTLPQTTRIPLFSGHETAPDGPYIALIMYDEQARLIRHGPWGTVSELRDLLKESILYRSGSRWMVDPVKAMKHVADLAYFETTPAFLEIKNGYYWETSPLFSTSCFVAFTDSGVAVKLRALNRAQEKSTDLRETYVHCSGIMSTESLISVQGLRDFSHMTFYRHHEKVAYYSRERAYSSNLVSSLENGDEAINVKAILALSEMAHPASYAVVVTHYSDAGDDVCLIGNNSEVMQRNLDFIHRAEEQLGRD